MCRDLGLVRKKRDKKRSVWLKETKTDTSDSNTQGGVQHGRYQDSTRGDTRGYFTTSFPREGKGGG